VSDSTHTLGDQSPGSRVARMLASPAGVLVIVPGLVLAVGIVVLLLGRKATRDSAETMARHQLVAQAAEVQHDVAFALDQSDPVLASMKLLAEPALPTPDAVARLRDVVVGRPGIANVSIVFPVGVMWGTYVDRDDGQLMVQETRVGEAMRTNFGFKGGELQVVSVEKSTYDPRTRPQYELAISSKARVWMPPRTFSSSHKTGLTVTEPVFSPDGTLTAVLAVDFDVAELSKFIRRPPLAGARTVMFTADGTILAYPSVAIPQTAIAEKRLLRYQDFKEPALDALFAAIGSSAMTDQRFMRLEASDGAYLASVAIVGGKRAGTAAPLDWYLATLVPESTLFGATKRFGRATIITSAAALAVALGVALMFAWNLLRMRRAVGVARAAAKSAEDRARELGSYRLVERLGQGGMGEVWRAEHQLLARQAAIKLVRREVLVDQVHAQLVHERFRREAQTLASLRSRHTIELYDYGVTQDDSFFFVMELLDGVDLAQLVRAHGPQPASRVISIIAQACGSLAEAHDAGLLHRDIKPANLFLCRAADEVDIVKLLDFGIVHNISEPIETPITVPVAPRLSGNISVPVSGERLTSEGSVIGTPGYIPPEQAVGAPLDARGDLYALGCVAWWLLVGDEVYPRRSGDDAVHAHVTEPIPTLRDKVRGWLPQELEDVIVSCLAKRPTDRPANARVLADALYAIAIPEEHAWSRAKAVAWWASLTPIATSAPEASTVAGAVVVAKAPADASTAVNSVVVGAPPTVSDVPADRMIVVQRATPSGGSEAQTVATRKSLASIDKD